MKAVRLVLGIAAFALGCNAQPAAPAAPATPAAPSSQPPSSPAERLNAWIPNHGAQAPANPHGAQAPAPAPTGALRGTVRETMNAAGYTYLHLDVPGGDRWVATTQMQVAAGDRVVVAGGNVMTNFHSRTLDRTFPEILFASGVQVDGAQVAPTPAPAVAPTPAPAPTAAAGARRGTVRETMNSGGYTYVRVEGGGASTWAAVPQTVVAVGDEVEVPAGSEMPGFRSATLNRTFEQITFSSEVRVLRSAASAAPAAPPPGHP